MRTTLARRCTVGVVMLMLAAGTVGLAVATDDEPAEATAAAIDSLPTGPTVGPSASVSPSAEVEEQRRTEAAPTTAVTRPAPETTETASATPSPSTKVGTASARPSPAASTEGPATANPSPSPATTEEPRERGPLGDLLAGLLGQD